MKRSNSGDLLEVMENQADSCKLGKGNGKKNNLGNFYLAVLTSVLNTARGKAGNDINL